MLSTLFIQTEGEIRYKIEERERKRARESERESEREGERKREKRETGGERLTDRDKHAYLRAYHMLQNI